MSTIAVQAGKECSRCGLRKALDEFSLTRAGYRLGVCRECWRIARRKGREQGRCAHCDATFTKPRVDSRFCSNLCYGASVRVAAGMRPRKPLDGEERVCATCGEAKLPSEFPQKWRFEAWRPGRTCHVCVNAQSRRSYHARRKSAGAVRPVGASAPEGATSLTAEGYVREKRTGHHRATGQGWVLQHVLVAEGKYGFPIPRGVTVHHRNNDRADNRPENLELRIGNHGIHGDLIPTILRVPEFRAIARQVLAQYDD